MNAVSSNALSLANAAALANANKGTFTSLLTTKQGTEKGGVVYGDDTVLTVIVTGFRYDRLVQRSLDKVAGMTDADLARLIDGKVGMDGRGKSATERAVTLADAQAARDELVASFMETLNGTNEATTDHVYEPLVVTDENGASETVRGARVYKCVAGTAHRHACIHARKAPHADTNLAPGSASVYICLHSRSRSRRHTAVSAGARSLSDGQKTGFAHPGCDA